MFTKKKSKYETRPKSRKGITLSEIRRTGEIKINRLINFQIYEEKKNTMQIYS